VLPAFMIGLIWLCLVQNRARWCGLAAMGFAVLSLGRQPIPDVHILGEAYQLAWRTPSGDMAVMHEKRAGYEPIFGVGGWAGRNRPPMRDMPHVVFRHVALNCNLAQNWLW
ncbi:MAG: hypothetical protein VX296_04975, partial [Pseudomonadota bacterium]|nr:hypothetical protein [Pseudomonadota bacterium]